MTCFQLENIRCLLCSRITLSTTVVQFKFWTDTQFTSAPFDTKSTTDLFSLWDPWEKILSNAGLEPNLSLLRGPWHKKYWGNPALFPLLIKSRSTFLTWGYSRRGRGANSWGVAMAWLRLDRILGCWSLVLIITSKNWQHSSTAEGLQGCGLTGGRINHWARVPLTVWNFIWQNRETYPDVYSRWLLSLSTGWSNLSTLTLANINSAGVFALGAEPPTSCRTAVRQLNLTSDPLVGKRTDNVSTRSNKGVFAA